MRIRVFGIAFLAMQSLCDSLHAQTPAPDTIIEDRIAHFREMGTSFKAISDELKQTNPSVATIQQSASHIETLGSKILSWFPAGTGPTPKPEKGILDTILDWFSSAPSVSFGEETRAKAAVWSQWPAFEGAHGKFYVEARKMREVSQRGDTAAVAAQYKVLGGTCKSCHDSFREKRDDD